jgi:hypothetical protein
VKSIQLDGKEITGESIEFDKDGGKHTVRVILGEKQSDQSPVISV